MAGCYSKIVHNFGGRTMWGFVATACWLGSTSVSAGPTIIRDARVQDLNVTPFLGRGYSVSTNTFQSACLVDVQMTEPNYNYKYDFVKLDTSNSKSQQLRSKLSGQSFKFVGDLIEQSKVTKEEASTASSNMSNKFLSANLRVYTYYASVDETRSRLAASASKLLKRADFPGFFAACGPYYIRGITRISEMTSVFNWQEKKNTSAETTQSTKTFADTLQNKLRGVSDSPEGGLSKENLSKASLFAMSASSRNLNIVTRAWGLGKKGSTKLVSYDIGTFRSSVKDAFQSMLDPLTGLVHSMEVVPWVENAEFQDLIELQTEDVISGETVPLYKKKDILIQNAEFLQELWSASRVKLNAYYKASLCGEFIRSRWYKGGALDTRYASVQLLNHRTKERNESPPVTVKALDAKLSKEKVADTYLKEYQEFMYLGSGNVNVKECVKALLRDPTGRAGQLRAGMQSMGGGTGAARSAMAVGAAAAAEKVLLQGRGLYLIRYASHKECAQLRERFVNDAVLDSMVDEHCMPQGVDDDGDYQGIER